MKKFTGFIAAAAIAMTPMSSSALEALTDNAMNDVTAQAGVSIAIDDVVLFQTVETSKYTDTDGVNETATVLHDAESNADAASLVISDKETLKIINGIYMSNETALDAPGELVADGWIGTKNFATGYKNRDTDGNGSLDVFIPSDLKIDIGQCKTLTRAAFSKLNAKYADDHPVAALQGTYIVTGDIREGGPALDADNRQDRTVSGVVIGLPTVEITTTSDSYTVGVTMVDEVTDPSLNSGKNFIKIEKGASLMAILGGRLEIAPH